MLEKMAPDISAVNSTTDSGASVILSGVKLLLVRFLVLNRYCSISVLETGMDRLGI